MRFPKLIISFILFILFTVPLYSQVNTIIYDGTIGIGHCHIFNDSVVAIDIIRKSPAWKVGIENSDRIIEINGIKISGCGIKLKEANSLLYDKAGSMVHLKIKRRGIDSLLSFTIKRDHYSDRLATSGYHYLADPDRKLSIEDILTDSINRLFKHNSKTNNLVHFVKEGSNADIIGLQPGDRIINLEEEINNHEVYSIDDEYIPFIVQDSFLLIQRKMDTLTINSDPTKLGTLGGVTSKFRYDLNSGCVWLKFVSSNRITENLTFLLELSSSADSIFLFEISSNGDITERRAGRGLSLDERDYTYKGWVPVRVNFIMNTEQTFYVRLVSAGSLSSPWIAFTPLDAVSEYDRIERMFLSAFLGMMLIIGFYYLILFISNKKRSNLWYSLFILLFGISLFVHEGYMIEISRIGIYSLYNSFQFLIYSAPSLFFILFGIAYLDLKSNLKWWFRIAVSAFIIALALDIILLIEHLISPHHNGSMYYILYGISDFITTYIAYLILIVPAVIMIFRKFKPAFYFLIASIILIISQIYYSMTWGPFNMHNFSSSNLVMLLNNTGHYMGAILQFLIFSIGIAQKMKIDEKEKKHVQERLIDQLMENEKLKDKVNRELEEKVRKRTEKINDQKEEIESQLDEIETQRDELMNQRDMVMAQKQEITDSINYAQRIQHAVLPNHEYMDLVMPEYFVLFKPRDIVSGDFYWIKEIKNFLIIVVADCTGHGVPGAFMSMLGISFLNEQIGRSRLDRPGEILDRIRKKVKQTLAQKGLSEEQKDGMDMAIAIIDKESKELQFAGAFNPLYLIRASSIDDKKELRKYASFKEEGVQLFELKGDRQPIGVYYEETEFSTIVIQLQKDDTIYLFSDGYADQMGGPKGKKYMSRKFKNSLISIQQMNMSEQKQFLDQTLEEWSDGYEQVDDVLVMGIRIK